MKSILLLAFLLVPQQMDRSVGIEITFKGPQSELLNTMNSMCDVDAKKKYVLVTPVGSLDCNNNWELKEGWTKEQIVRLLVGTLNPYGFRSN